MIITMPGIFSQGGDTLKKGLVYQLPGETSFSGNTYINTGVMLYDTQKDFTLLFDFTDSSNRSQYMTVMHCMYEGQKNGISYPGLNLDFFTSTSPQNYRFASGADPYDYMPSWGTAGGQRRKICVIFKAAKFDRMAWSYNGGAVGTTYTTRTHSGYGYTTLTETVYLGCYRDIYGNRGRYFNGKMHDVRIWERALTDAEVSKLFE